MKRFLPFLSVAIIAAACNTSPELAQKEATGAYLTAPATQTDTAGLAEYQDWKAQNELAEVEAEQNNEAIAESPVKKVASKPKTVAKAPVRKTSTAVAKKPTTQTPPPVSEENNSSAEGSTGNSTAGTGTGSESGAGEGGAGTGTEVAKKEGISKAAKGAIIGAVGGAAGGAVINKKNRAAGAIIGAVIGAGGGYVIGRKMDQKDGRTQ